MKNHSLPRPSRPSVAPPTGPLPSLPVAKSRVSNVGAASRVTQGSLLPAPATVNRAVSSSALPTRPTSRGNPVSPHAPSSSLSDAPVAALPPGKTLRKTVSIGAFPQPPKHVGRNSSYPSSPLSACSTPSAETVGQTLSSASAKTPSRNSGGKKSAPRVSNIGARGPVDNQTSDPSAALKDGKGNVLVSVRVRPDSGAKDSTQELDWVVNNKQSLIAFKGKEGGEHYYDNVFDPQDNNRRVYDAAAKRLVRRVMEGYHGTVFAYGMTGTGKTFSMQGTATNPGVIPLAITDIFSYIRETPHREFLLRVSYLEIYNEKIHDLLAGPVAGANGQAVAQEEIKLREDSKRGVYASPLKEEIVQSPTQLLRVIARGDNARRVSATQFNARSSRSHAVVQIVVESRERVSGSVSSKRSAISPGGVRVSTLSLIDLAGSEKAAESKERRTEGSHINKSLLTLGTVIARLSSDKDKATSDKEKGSKDKHLPYRDSKLTRLLQPALSGNSLVSILCTIQIGASGSPAAINTHTGETLNTLKFASRAKNNIVSHAKKADESMGTGGDAGSRALLDRYRLEIQELRKQLEEQNKAKAKPDAQVARAELERDEEEEKIRELEEKQRHEEQMLEMQLARTALKERIEHLNRLILSSKSLGVNGRSFSSMSYQRGGSVMSMSNVNELRPMSVRSSGSHATLEVPAQRGSQATLSPPIDGSEEEDSLGDNGDGTASQGAQIVALQSDLADRNRYIATLEKRLLQARRSSHSRVSMSLSQKVVESEDGGLSSAMAEKDAEISSLRAQLEDKERMISALTSARKKGEAAQEIGSEGSPGSRRTSRQHSEGSPSNTVSTGKTTASPRQISPLKFPSQKVMHTPRTQRNIADMTRMLDELISKQVDSVKNASLEGPRRGSLDRELRREGTTGIRRGSLPGESSGPKRSSLRPVDEVLVDQAL